jgi:hypothetical protein
MQLALEALEKVITAFGSGLTLQQNAITALRQALETKQEPVAWANSFDLQNFDMKVRTGPDLHHTVPLYTAPPKQWVSLTDQEVWQAIDNVLEGGGWLDVARVLEQAFKEKNT